MTWAVAWRPLAERDLVGCAAHIAQDNTDAALRFIDAVAVSATCWKHAWRRSTDRARRSTEPCRILRGPFRNRWHAALPLQSLLRRVGA